MRRIKEYYGNKKSLIVIFCLLVSVIVISIGFSAFHTTVSVTDIAAVVRPDADVRITSFAVSSTANGGSASNVDYNISSTIANLHLPNSNSSVTFAINVKNYGNVEMGISSISLPSSLDSKLDVSVSSYTLGTKLRDNNNSCEGTTNGCKLSISRTFYITIKYDSGAYTSSSVNFSSVKLDFAFVQAYSVAYVDCTSFSPTIDQKAALKGTTLAVSVGSYDGIYVQMDGTSSPSYTYSGGVLTIQNITGNVTVTRLIKYTVTTNVTTKTFNMSSNFASKSCGAATSCYVIVPSGTSVTTSVTANYYNNASLTETVSASKTSGKINMSLKSTVTLGPYSTDNVSGDSITDLKFAKGSWDGEGAWDRAYSIVTFGDRSVTWTYGAFTAVPADAQVTQVKLRVGIGSLHDDSAWTASSNMSGFTPTSGTCYHCDDTPETREYIDYTATPTAAWLRSNSMTFKFTWKKIFGGTGYFYGTSVWITYRPI